MKPMKVSLSQLQPNPFRDIENYPLDPKKITKLRESIRDTGFWMNIEVRKNGAGYQIAYGHHRVEAARQELGKRASIYAILSKLDDQQMLQKMSRENMEEWGISAFASDLTCVGSTVRAFAAGVIKLETPGKSVKDSRARIAPSFRTGGDPEDLRDLRYTATTIAQFLGWGYKDNDSGTARVRDCLQVLEQVEAGNCKLSDFFDMNWHRAGALIKIIRDRLKTLEQEQRRREKAVKHAEKTGRPIPKNVELKEREIKNNVRRVATVASKVLKDEDRGIKDAKEAVAVEVTVPIATEEMLRPKKKTVALGLLDLRKTIDSLLSTDAIREKFTELEQYRQEERSGLCFTDATAADWKQVIAALRRLSRRAEKLAQRMEE